MGVDIAQLKALPQHVNPGGEVFFIVGIHIRGVRIHHHPIGGVGFQAIPRHGQPIAGTIGLIDEVSPRVAIAVCIFHHVRLHRRGDGELILRPRDNRTQVGDVLFLLHVAAMVVSTVIQRGTVLQQRIQLEVPVIQLLAEQEVTARVGSPASLFHHVDIAMAVAVEIVGGITRMLDEGILVQREHVIGFKAPNFYLPVLLLTEEEGGIVKVH